MKSFSFDNIRFRSPDQTVILGVLKNVMRTQIATFKDYEVGSC